MGFLRNDHFNAHELDRHGQIFITQNAYIKYKLHGIEYRTWRGGLNINKLLPMKKLLFTLLVTLTFFLLQPSQASAVVITLTVTNSTGHTIYLDLYGEYDNGCNPAPFGGVSGSAVTNNTSSIFYIDVGPAISNIEWFSIIWITGEVDCGDCSVGTIAGSKIYDSTNFDSVSTTAWTLTISNGYNSCTDQGDHETGTELNTSP